VLRARVRATVPRGDRSAAPLSFGERSLGRNRLRPARRQNRASLLAGWLLAAGPIQKSQTKPAALPDPRRPSNLPSTLAPPGGFSFGPANPGSSSPGVASGGATIRKSGRRVRDCSCRSIEASSARRPKSDASRASGAGTSRRDVRVRAGFTRRRVQLAYGRCAGSRSQQRRCNRAVHAYPILLAGLVRVSAAQSPLWALDSCSADSSSHPRARPGESRSVRHAHHAHRQARSDGVGRHVGRFGQIRDRQVCPAVLQPGNDLRRCRRQFGVLLADVCPPGSGRPTARFPRGASGIGGCATPSRRAGRRAAVKPHHWLRPPTHLPTARLTASRSRDGYRRSAAL
jgi:hypothetical protein